MFFLFAFCERVRLEMDVCTAVGVSTTHLIHGQIEAPPLIPIGFSAGEACSQHGRCIMVWLQSVQETDVEKVCL